MEKLFRTISIPKNVRFTNSQDHLIHSLLDILDQNDFKKPAVLFAEILYQNQKLTDLKEEILNRLPDNTTTYKCNNADIEVAHSLQRQLILSHCDAVVAVGGGQTLDIGKYIATKNNIPCINIPTQISHDGFCSPVAVLHLKGLSYSLGASMPFAVIVNMPTIISAPVNRLRAGLGDLLSNITAIEDWKLAYRQGKSDFDDFAALTAGFSAQSILNLHPLNLKEPTFVEEITKALLFSGIAMEIAGSSRPCSGSEHLISHSIDQLFPNSNHLHGEQVALATIISAYLHQLDWQLWQNYYREIGLPTTCSELNLTSDDFINVILNAPSTRPDRFTVFDTIEMNKDYITEVCNITGVI